MTTLRRGENILALYYDRKGPPVWSDQPVLYLLALTPMGARCNTLECDEGNRREEPVCVNRYQFVCVSAVTNAIVPLRRALAPFPTALASLDYKHNSCIVRACARRCVGPASAQTCALISCTPACVL